MSKIKVIIKREMLGMKKNKLRYAILKEIDKGNKKLKSEDFKIDEETFYEAINFLVRENYLKGIPYGSNIPMIFTGTAYLTEKGEDYLEENKILSKTYKGLKEILSFIK